MQVVALVLVVAALNGCASDGGADPPGPAITRAPATTTSMPTISTALPASTTTVAPSEEQQILDAVHAAWAAIRSAKMPPNPDDPALAQNLTGAQLDRTIANITQMAVNGHESTLPPGSQSSHSPEVVEIDGDLAIVSDCAVDDAIVIESSTGLVVNGDVVTVLWRETMQRVDGVWKLADTFIESETEGVVACVR